eukprot:GHUV01038477.1.p1 GENE.GHUV01038477.1~~GHUV01038477.1.p1  ORF type:complete len:341 (+),score=98.26 GHUV01038477.1:636-1658(+)
MAYNVLQHGPAWWHVAGQQQQCRRRARCYAVAAQETVHLNQSTCRLKLTVAYDGTNFQGFQYQTQKVRTVQGELEKAAGRVLLPAGRVVGASRTDAGAHATGQIAHLDVTGSAEGIDPHSLMMYLNGVLPDDVKVQQVEVAPPGFDSHYSSVGKMYCYKLAYGVPDPLQSRQRWWLYGRWCERSRGKPQSAGDLVLDVAAMQEAVQHILGVHDFTTFMDNKRPAGLGALKRKRPKLAALGIKPVRTREKNTRLLWEADVKLDDSPDAEWRGHVNIHLAGNGFLYRMVRLIAAALVEVGHRRMTPSQFLKVLDSGDRSALTVEAAPAHGLYLTQVRSSRGL